VLNRIVAADEEAEEEEEEEQVEVVEVEEVEEGAERTQAQLSPPVEVQIKSMGTWHPSGEK